MRITRFKVLFFFFAFLVRTWSKQKHGSILSDDNYSFPQESLKSSSDFTKQKQIKHQDDIDSEKSILKTFQDYSRKLSSTERSSSDEISNTETDRPYQFENSDTRHQDSLHPFSFESLKNLKLNQDGDLKNEDKILSLITELDKNQQEKLHRILQLEDVFTEIREDNLEMNTISEFASDRTELSFEESNTNEAESFEAGEIEQDNQDPPSLEREICFEDESNLMEGQQSGSESGEFDLQRVLSLINIDVSINIEIEKIPQQQEEEENHGTRIPIVVPDIDPGNQECQTAILCTYTIVPRLGRRCLCRQEASCSPN